MQLAAFAVCAAVMSMVLRRMRPDAGLALSLAGGLLMALAVLPVLSTVVTGVSSLAQAGGVSEGYMGQLLKVGGISLLVDFAAQTCRDAGEDGLAMKTELAGRVMLISLALPVMQTLLAQIMSLSP